MRSLEQIASENYIEHTSRDIAIMETVRTEAILDIVARIDAADPELARRIAAAFWSDNPRFR